ncbi:spermine synthase isoform X1 [Chrysoperla carnea]|uniref:spermine synthase isoform X1 n=1 Tax=Chrysoperla carnea TaxID=189513 RepID=UPI001D08FFA8|nr:spermine synthase isoform X1 [Chrysoperla carnea]
MAVHTVLLDFSFDPALGKTDNQVSNMLTKVENILKDYLHTLKIIHSMHLDGGFVKIFTSEKGCMVTLRTYDHGLLTITWEYYKADNQEPLLNLERVRELERQILEDIEDLKRSESFIPIKRGTFMRYYPTADERLLEYDIDKLLFEERSPFQRVQIVHSKSLGNMLVLDELQNISERDLIYTETLMRRGIENYENKEIIILGGGDGALLYELLKEKPKMVTMLEIDEVVLKACNEYMKSICGNVLEKRRDTNYEIIIGDCMKSIDKYIEEGRKFDYVFGDLTDIPISDTPSGEIWNFIMTILDKSFKVLKPTGKFMTHGNGVNSPESLIMYENQLAKLRPPVKFEKCTAFIPSFMEDWVFYQICFDSKP